MSDDPENPNYRFIHTNKDLENILNAKSIREIARSRNLKYLGHVCRQENNAITKRMMFAEPKKNLWEKIAKEIGIHWNQPLRTTQTDQPSGTFVRNYKIPSEFDEIRLRRTNE